eukprot:1042891-Pyramimonas_sp.AAC.1
MELDIEKWLLASATQSMGGDIAGLSALRLLVFCSDERDTTWNRYPCHSRQPPWKTRSRKRSRSPL